MHKFGIMQGRLVPPEPGRFQSFPRERWEEEFGFAKDAGLDYIEWIYDAYGDDANPILKTGGGERLRSLVANSGVKLRSMCADYFMDFPLVRCTLEERSARLDRLSQLLHASAEIGINRVVVPFVDASAIQTHEDLDAVVAALQQALPVAHQTGVELHLETALSPESFAELLSRISDAMLKVNYDSGNSASLGYAVEEEFKAYGDRVGSVHIKDRKLGGGTVPLGTGNADLEKLFECLEKINYRGDFTLQVARGTEGDEVAWARQNLAYLKRYLH